MLVKTSEALAKSREYYFSSKLRALEQLRRQGKDIINLGIGNPAEQPHDEVINAFVREIMKNGVHGYQSYKGSENMLKSVSRWYDKHFGVCLPHDKSFLPLCGSKEGLSFIVQAFVNPGDEILVPDPGYPTYQAVAKLHYAKVKYYNLTETNGYVPDFDELDKLVSERTRLMFVNYPNMPTGAHIDSEFFDRLVKWARKHKVLVVNDNPYAMLFEKKLSIFSVAGAHDIAIELHSLSKSHNMAGWRVGFAVAAPDYINALLKVKSNYNSGHFKPVQAAVSSALALDNSWYKELRQVYNNRRLYVVSTLTSLGFDASFGDEGMFVWARVPGRFGNGEDVSDWLVDKAGVFLTPGIVFGKNGDMFVRVSLAAESAVIQKAFARIEKVFNRKTIKL